MANIEKYRELVSAVTELSRSILPNINGVYNFLKDLEETSHVYGFGDHVSRIVEDILDQLVVVSEKMDRLYSHLERLEGQEDSNIVDSLERRDEE